MPLTYSTLVSA